MTAIWVKTRYAHISGKAARDGRYAHTLDGRQLRRYIASMREVVEAYKKTMLEMNY